MPLTWNLKEIENSGELWVHKDYMRVRWIEEGAKDPEEGFWIYEGDGKYRQATDTEVTDAKSQAADEVTTTRESKHDPEIQVRMLPEELRIYQKGYGPDSKTEALIWLSLMTMIGKITEENYEEVFRRVQVIEKVYGPRLGSSEGPVFFTLEDIKRRIGLKTNASFQDEPKGKFDRKMAKIQEKEANTA